MQGLFSYLNKVCPVTSNAFWVGHTVRRWIKVLYSGTLMSLMINGTPLAPFKVGGAGIRQGGPLSPAHFILFIDSFINLPCVKLHDRGVQCGSSTHSILSISDDCSCLLHDRHHAEDFLGS